jgi:hypothetical protein
MAFILESGLLLGSFLFLFIFKQAGLTDFTPQLIGLLVFVFIVMSAGKKKRFSLGGPLGVFVLNTVIFLVIFSTGGISSSFFFVLYFLVFAIAFVFDPNLAFVFAAGSLIVFVPEALKSNGIENFIKIGSLFLISPLAYFFGNMFKKSDQNQDDVVKVKERAQDAADTISKDVDDVLKDGKQMLEPQDVEKLNEILEETEDLRQEGKE